MSSEASKRGEKRTTQGLDVQNEPWAEYLVQQQQQQDAFSSLWFLEDFLLELVSSRESRPTLAPARACSIGLE